MHNDQTGGSGTVETSARRRCRGDDAERLTRRPGEAGEELERGDAGSSDPVKLAVYLSLFTFYYLPFAIAMLAVSLTGDCEIGDAACENRRATNVWKAAAVDVIVYTVLAYGVARLARR
jgi:hypothetical protein